MSAKSDSFPQNREKSVFIGINYETGEPILREIKSALGGMGFTPIIAKDLPSPPDKIHDSSMFGLQSCRYAIFDITDPAGQLMELERSIDYDMKTFVYYSSVHLSAMPLTFTKMLQKWNKGDIFQYTSTKTIRKCIRATLINYSPKFKNKTLEDKARYIIGITSTSKYKEENVFLIVSMGTLEGLLEKKEGFDAINKFRGVKILITGWDKNLLKKMIEERSTIEWDKWYIVAEHCTLFSPTKDKEEGKFKLEEVRKFFDEKSIEMDHVRKCNKIVIESILEYSEETGWKVTFRSQGDEAGICYYLNPPSRIETDLQNISDSKKVDTANFLEELNTAFSLWHKIDDDSSDNPPTIKFSVKDEGAKELLLYAIVKTNAKLRRFLPYTIKIVPLEFHWKDIPGKDDNRLKEFLKETLGVDWIKNAKITKSKDKKIVSVSDERGNLLSLTLNEEGNTVTLVDEVIYTFIAKNDGGELKIYPNKETVILTLGPLENSEEQVFSLDDLKTIREKALEKIDKMYRENYELFSKHIQPQSDICIDIFCKTKDEVIEEILKKIIGDSAQEESLIVYASTGRETDIPMILKCYNLNYDFIAIGEQSISERLRNVGVLPVGKNLSDIIECIRTYFVEGEEQSSVRRKIKLLLAAMLHK